MECYKLKHLLFSLFWMAVSVSELNVKLLRISFKWTLGESSALML